jgi:tetraacyldisaccharide 4'-kinase
LGLISRIFSAALTCREYFYNSGFKKTRNLPLPVISIGNITLGGTGKTPAVIALSQEAQKRGLRPCILTRGYKGRVKGPCLSTKNSDIFHKAELAGDEAAYMSYRLRDVPIVKGKNRFLAGVYALGSIGRESIDIFILDDGFQHRALSRDLDILLIDATRPFGNEMLFPEGILREPLESIRRADIALITKSDGAGLETIREIEYRINLYNPDVPVYTARHMPTSVILTSGGSESPDFLAGRDIYVFSGIANPAHFESLLKTMGANIVKVKKFRDHYNYSQRDINSIKKEANNLDIITTEKDLVKLKNLELPEKLSALRIDFSVDESFYDRIFRILTHSIERKP